MTLKYFTRIKISERYIRQNAALYVLTTALVLFSIYPSQAYSEYIAQINIQQGSRVDAINIKLLESDAPLAVQNFRNYASDGDYTNSFIHRNAPKFIIQGGGYTFDPALNDGSFTYSTGGLQTIIERPPVKNEFGNSNLRGTLAMAKLNGDPDSATSQWFINVVDNALLDTQNGGFTVFAEVLGNGMDVIDVIDGQAIYDRSDVDSAFGSLPLVNYSLPDPVTDINLVSIKSINEVLSISPDINYGTVTPGTNLQPEIVLLNTGDIPVSIGNIGSQKALSPPYSIVTELCSNGILFPGQRCSLIALFSPGTQGVFEDSFDIEFPGLGINYLIDLSGTGGPDAVEADISSTFSSINFGSKDIYFNEGESPYVKATLISNSGNVRLNFNSITLSSDSGTEFSLSDAVFNSGNNCILIDFLEPGEACQITFLYFPLTDGEHIAKLIIDSNDPDESPFEIPIFGVGLPEDIDNVDAVIEDSAPNNGDGNNDGIFDSRQSNVASLPDLMGNYNTYISEPLFNQLFTGVRIVEQNANDENPDNIIIEAGVHELTINNVAGGGVVAIGLFLPAGVSPSEYYIFGPTAGNATPHWYNFDSDGETGVTFIGVATLSSTTGKNIQRNVVSLRFKNGGRGDSSSELDNKIIVKSGIKYTNKTNSSGSGFLSYFFLQIFILLLLPLRFSCYVFARVKTQHVD